MRGSDQTTALVIGFAGLSRSGKSTVSSGVAAQTSWGIASFGDVVRETAKSRGLDSLDPRVLLSLGSTLVSEDCDRFCRAALTVGGWPNKEVVLLDGVRHQKVVDMIKTIIDPARFRLIVVTASSTARAKRLLQTSTTATISLSEIDSDPISADAGLLHELADYIADGEASSSELSKHLASLIAGWRQ